MAAEPLVIIYSYHHGNTEKIARTLAAVLGASVKRPAEVTDEDTTGCSLIGFGSGIYGGTVHPSLLRLAERLPPAKGTRAFLFSTYGAPAFAVTRNFVADNHAGIRKKLELKGYEIVGEFGCAGWNTNSFLKYFGGINRGRPDDRDCADAEAFARSLVKPSRQ